jgi:hypothetical protein
MPAGAYPRRIPITDLRAPVPGRRVAARARVEKTGGSLAFKSAFATVSSFLKYICNACILRLV